MIRFRQYIKNWFLLAPLLAVLLTACGGSRKIIVSEDLNIPSQTDSRIPLKVGLVLTPQFVNLIYKPVPNACPVFIGNALKVGSERVCLNLFDEVVPIVSIASAGSSQVDVIVIPACEEIEYRLVDRATVRIRSRFLWRITTPDSREIYSTTVIGEALRKVSTTVMASTMEREQGEVYFLSLQDQFRKAQNDLHSGGWWKNTWWKQP